VAAQLQQIEALYAIDSSEELRAALGGRTEQEFAAARDFGVLMVEFSLYAMRNPAAQAELAKRYRQLRGRLAELITKRYARHQTSPPMSPSTWPRWRSPPTPACSSSTPPSQARSPGELHADAMIQLLDPPS
jgi:hypothetical protein